MKSHHKFRADELHPTWCSLCGRKQVAHLSATVCPHCGASSVPSQAGCCQKCGQLVGVERIMAAAPPTNNS
jgi:hypothetical protein